MSNEVSKSVEWALIKKWHTDSTIFLDERRDSLLLPAYHRALHIISAYWSADVRDMGCCMVCLEGSVVSMSILIGVMGLICLVLGALLLYVSKSHDDATLLPLGMIFAYAGCMLFIGIGLMFLYYRYRGRQFLGKITASIEDDYEEAFPTTLLEFVELMQQNPSLARHFDIAMVAAGKNKHRWKVPEEANYPDFANLFDSPRVIHPLPKFRHTLEKLDPIKQCELVACLLLLVICRCPDSHRVNEPSEEDEVM